MGLVTKAIFIYQITRICGDAKSYSCGIGNCPKIKSLSELTGAHKTTSSKYIHLVGLTEFRWQRSFHDHIIRNHESYQNIVNYIETNPERWVNDKFYL